MGLENVVVATASFPSDHQNFSSTPLIHEVAASPQQKEPQQEPLRTSTTRSMRQQHAVAVGRCCSIHSGGVSPAPVTTTIGAHCCASSPSHLLFDIAPSAAAAKDGLVLHLEMFALAALQSFFAPPAVAHAMKSSALAVVAVHFFPPPLAVESMRQSIVPPP